MDSSLSVTTPSIYTGAWINWTRGKVEGSTLTLSTRDSAFLVAFLALYVRLAGNRLWNIICFVTFLLRSSPEPHDGLYHQQQALLKAKPSDLSSIWQHLRLGWEWRNAIGSRSALHRSLWLVILSVVHAAIFVTAGIFSSKVASTVSDVLLNDISCGQFPVPSFGQGVTTVDEVHQFAAITARVQRNLNSASAYASSCYRSSAVNTSWVDCRALGKARVEWNKTIVPCPFGANLCKTDAVRFDTGPICSHMDFGINAPKADRISYRRAMECSPLRTDGYRRGPLAAESAGIPEKFRAAFDKDETYYGYFYGPNRDINSSATYYVPSREYPENEISTITINNVPTQYELSSESSTFGQPGNYIPISELQVANAYTTLVFLRKNTAYFEPVHDPWFNATQASSKSLILPDGSITPNVTLYSDPEFVSVLGCTETWQWCNSYTNECTPFIGSSTSPMEDVNTIHLNTRQNATLSRIYTASAPTFLVPMIAFLGAHSLLASKSAGLESLPLPDNQWIQELDHWFGTGMSAVQLDILQFVTGDGDSGQYLYQLPPANDEKWMCHNQITQRTDFTSFSVLALCLILIIGGLIMLISVFLNEQLTHMQSFRKTRKGKHWIAAGVYNLQARFFELKELGGNWMGIDKPIPTTKADERFTMPLDLENVAHSFPLEVKHNPVFSFGRGRNTHKRPHVGTDPVPSTFGLSREDLSIDHCSIASAKAPTYRTTTSSSGISEVESLLTDNGYKMTIR